VAVQTPLLQINPAQQPAPESQAPPAFRQQFKAPSLAMPLSAQNVDPPDWLHCDDEVQDAPGHRSPPLEGELPPLHVPFTQRDSPQHPESVVQMPPPQRQQFVSPPVADPFQAQSTAPPLWEHWLAASQADPGGN
jgi:hypothetical protein